MHISEGILSGPVLISGAAIAVVGTTIGLKKLDYEQISRAGILSSAFFVASLIHVPIGPSNVHLILNGVVGLMLGWAAFPVILVALLLQCMLFQYGGITALGVNVVIMALPAVICHYLFSPFIKKKSAVALSVAFACGSLSVLFSGIIVAFCLMFTEESFFEISAMVIAAHIPVMIIEGMVTAFCVSFLKKVQPEMLSVGK